MLSERVLDELSWHSAVSEELCKALWPDLAVESKLQVLEAYQGDRLSPTPDWLTDLALEDGSPAIHYYALRHVHLKTQQENVPEDVKQFYLVTDDELARHAKAHALKHPLVKAALVKLNTFSATEDLRCYWRSESACKWRLSAVLSGQ